MQVVVDANQASQLPSARSVTREHSISLSPSVLAEILLAQSPTAAETGVSAGGGETLNPSVCGNGVEPNKSLHDIDCL